MATLIAEIAQASQFAKNPAHKLYLVKWTRPLIRLLALIFFYTIFSLRI